jgi:hypothetical protein
VAVQITRSKDILSVWQNKIFDHPDIKAITERVLYHDASFDSHLEVSSIRYQQEINFFAFSVSRAPTTLIGGSYRAVFEARTTYTILADPRGQNYIKAIDAIESLQEIVISEIGESWDGLINGMSLPQTPSFPVVTNIIDEPVFQIQYNVQGFICQT